MLATSSVQRLLLLALVLLLAAIGVVLVTNRGSGQTESAVTTKSKFDGPTMPAGLRAHDFSLTDQSGHRVTLSAYPGRVVVLTFIHSLCEDDCPFMVEQIKGALNDLPASGRGVPTIGVSVAPAEDTVAHRRAFLNQHRMNDRIAFVNGSTPVMRTIWRGYAIAPGSGPHAHSAFVLLIDKRGFERVGFAADQLTPEDLAHDIRMLQAERA